jgi:acid ceramidase
LDDNFDRYLILWILGDYTEGHYLTFTLRTVMEQEATYAAALQRITRTKFIGPSYIIIGGTQSGEGAIISNSPNTTQPVNVTTLAGQMRHNGQRFIAVTSTLLLFFLCCYF